MSDDFVRVSKRCLRGECHAAGRLNPEDGVCDEHNPPVPCEWCRTPTRGGYVKNLCPRCLDAAFERAQERGLF